MLKNIEGLKLIPTKTFSDSRGYFRESYRRDIFRDILGRDLEFVQDNESLSAAGVLRGLHFQRPPHAQAKLVRVLRGAIYDVAVDLRPNSPTFKQWAAFELNADDGSQLFVPEGLAHGFCALTEGAVVSYKVSDFYAPECEGGVRWDDPELAIPWPCSGASAIVSAKDAVLPLLSELNPIGW
ncbi:MAG: dTDP-4-dehydrorhamnose 3,5-epimerase [Candidatus Adiutrix sp.]|jgi:dTDP-4-dehydrorhamnose 3,5-epimerase|nr:dTDP-4-dehydrorhamnose 3,5-epimerase [Candidatus Adiutrix sp.]